MDPPKNMAAPVNVVFAKYPPDESAMRTLSHSDGAHASVNSFQASPIPAANVASVPQRSLLRYPGGKTWLVPHIREWFKYLGKKPRLLIEPFVGGGIVSLTAVMENLVENCLLCELDRDVAALWQASLCSGPELQRRIRQFKPTREAVNKIACSQGTSVVDRGFRTLVLNRTRRGGILSRGTSLLRAGENGRGLASRWYPDTLEDRLVNIRYHADRIEFRHTDGIEVLESQLSSAENSVVFVDPPYTLGGKRAGRRLYTHHDIDHEHLFGILSDAGTEFLMTYNDSPEIAELVRKHHFHAVFVEMKTTHHRRINELVITRNAVFDVHIRQ